MLVNRSKRNIKTNRT